jgi:hypothetical protein
VLARLARVLLIAALLAGWQAALVHPLEHSDGHGGLVHLGGDHSDGSELCDALAALTACAPHANLAFDAPAPARDSALSAETEWRLAEAPPFLAQGPPAPL